VTLSGSSFLGQTITFPETVIAAHPFGAETGGKSLPDLDVADDLLLGAADPGIHVPFFCNFSDFLHFHPITSLQG
jgi:hypothetical protein